MSKVLRTCSIMMSEQALCFVVKLSKSVHIYVGLVFFD